MRRIQFIEIHDQPWFPAFLRDQVTDALQMILHLGNFYHPIAARLREALEKSGSGKIIDLCSGAGGPWLWLYKDFDRLNGSRVSICLTDKYPNVPAFNRANAASGGKIHFHSNPVDVTKAPPGVEGFRTLFASFHHFPPGDAEAILQDAVNHRQGIGVFEAPGRYAATLLLAGLVPLADLLITPFLRPFRWSRLVFTYLLPVVPLVLLFDGIVSCLRVYSPGELTELVARLTSANEYRWDIGVERSGLLAITYLIGCPCFERSGEAAARKTASHLLSDGL